jgi:hypothetical protein
LRWERASIQFAKRVLLKHVSGDAQRCMYIPSLREETDILRKSWNHSGVGGTHAFFISPPSHGVTHDRITQNDPVNVCRKKGRWEMYTKF